MKTNGNQFTQPGPKAELRQSYSKLQSTKRSLAAQDKTEGSPRM